MDTRAPFDDPEWAQPALAEHLERRLAAIEDRLDAIEGSLRTEIARDLQTASEEMRRSVSELGRLLLKDLGRLTHVLEDHRDEIVDRLTAPPLEPTPAPAATAAATSAEPAASTFDEQLEGEPLSTGVEAPAMTGEDGRWRMPGKRKRRSPKTPESRDTERS